MANMTNDSGRSGQQSAGNGGQEAAEPSMAQRAVAGASTLSHQQVRKARERFDQQVASQRAHITGRVRTLSRALNGAGGMLEDDDLVAQCLHFAGEKFAGVAGYVDELTPDQIAEDLRDVARERPAWFFGGAFMLGLALGRFARSTAGALAGAADGQAAGALGRGTRGAPARTAARAEPQAGSWRSSTETSTRSGAKQS
jgi:hypothetical protein